MPGFYCDKCKIQFEHPYYCIHKYNPEAPVLKNTTMTEIWKPQSFEVLQSWVDAILTEASDELNEWEMNFVTDMQAKVLSGWTLTPKQEDTLERIYAEKTK